MLPFFQDVIAPMLAALRPDRIVEIGSEHGKVTRKLCELASGWGGTVHAIDPAPLFDVGVWTKDLSPTLVVHEAKSLDALASIDRMDAVMIDGDHNWFTVIEELRLIERLAEERGQPQPFILLHDVAWPYGRRDLYYDPASIPAPHRQPHAQKGISPTASELCERGGMNAHLHNAAHEGGERNGVLTAVEDYLRETDHEFIHATIPAAFGLGILLPRALAARVPALESLVSPWLAPAVHAFIDRLETARIAMLTQTRA